MHAPGTVSPLDGHALPPVAATPEPEVTLAVTRARAAFPGWSQRTLAEREAAVWAIVQALLTRQDEVLALLREETGRSEAACRLPELVVAADYCKGAIRAARAALRPEKVRLSMLDFPGKRGIIEVVPRGVIGIIAPWNYPLMQFYKPLFPALLAGNTVVLKPSEYAPRTGAFLARVCAELLPPGVVELVQGGGDVGAALIRSGVDAVTFTGSVPTGRKVAAACAERLIPCSLELGGKDAAIVLSDCNLTRTVAGITYASLFNTGQDCSSIERVYVEEAIAERFVAQVAATVAKLKVAPEPNADLAPVQNEAQLRVVEEHVRDAIEKGAKLVAGGARTGAGFGFQPTVLDGCDERMKVVSEETFGPLIAILRVKDAEEAVRRANDSRYGLNGSVWTQDLRRGEALARRLDVGICHVNNHSWTGGTLGDVPWTGTKDTGPGVAGSRFAYATFTRPRVVMIDSNGKPEPFWFPFDADFEAFGRALVSRGQGSIGAVFTLLGLLGKRVKSAVNLVEQGRLK